jgi:hypothetical protein
VDDLIAKLRQRVQSGERAIDSEFRNARPFPPATPREIEESERQLGFALSPLLRRVYLEVANGGFGPAYGMIGVLGGAGDDWRKNAVDLYTEYRKPNPKDRHWAWPAKLLPVCHLGCAMYLCVDCSDARGRVTWFEPNPHCDGEPWDDAFNPLAESTDAWLSAWVDGNDLFERLIAESA